MARFAAIVVSIIFMATAHFAIAEDDIEALKKENVKLQRALAGGATVRKHLYARLAEADKEKAKLRRALDGGATVRKHLYGRLEESDKEKAKLQRALDGGATVRKHLYGRLETSDKEKAKLQKALAGGSTVRKHLYGRIKTAEEENSELREKLQGSHSDSGDGDTSEWASNVGSSLSSSIGGIQGTEVTTTSDDSVNIRVGNSGLFRIGGTALSSTGSELLSQIAQQLTTHDDASFIIVGHTDNVPVGAANRFADNTELSFARAASTVQYLQTAGVPVETMSAAGFGEKYPIATNDTPEGRRQNRRVEILVKRN